MNWMAVLFLVSLLLGQIGGVPIYKGVVVYVHDILLGILLVEGFVQYAVTSKFTKPRLIGPIVLFVVAAIFSFLTNSGRFAIPDLQISALYLVRWVFYAALYVLVIQLYTKKDIWLRGLFSVGVGLGVLGLIQFFFYPDLRNLFYLGWDPHYYRLFSTFLDPNYVGVFLVLTLILGLYLWQERKFRLLVAAGEIVCLLSLLLTYSRSSYLAFIAAAVTYAFIKRQRILILGIVAFIAAVLLMPKTPGTTLDLLRPDSTLARFGNWQEGIALIQSAPIFGHGFNTLRYISPENTTILSKSAAGLDSSILFVGATTGIVGLLAYGYLLYRAVWMTKGGLADIFRASLAALFIHSLFVNSAFYPWILMWFWIVLGVMEKSEAKPERRRKIRVSGGT